MRALRVPVEGSEENQGAAALAAFKMGLSTNPKQTITRSAPRKVAVPTTSETTYLSTAKKHLTIKAASAVSAPEASIVASDNGAGAKMEDVHAASSLLFLQRAADDVAQPCAASVPKTTDETIKNFFFI